MFKFFREIRRKRLVDGRIKKYLINSLGEVVLIVVGILLALQIDNWKQQSDDRATERLLMSELNKEFLANKKQWDTTIYYHRNGLRSAEFLDSQLPIKLEEVNLDSIAYHTYQLTWVFTFNPSNGVARSILNNSTFQVITNDELRQLLITWNDVLEDYQEEEIRAFNNYENQLKPFLKRNVLFTDDLDQALGDPRVDLSFLESLEFDNFVMDRYLDLDEILNNVTGELELIENTINRIIELSDPKRYE